MTSALSVYLIIFFCKIVEVSFATVRMVLITKGERVKGSFIAFFEITIWLALSSNVLTSIKTDPMKGLVYALGFVVGNYLGSLIEEKIALGIVTANIITSSENTEVIVDKLKELEIGYTILSAQGQKDENNFIVTYMARKRKKEMIKQLNNLNVKYFISVNESRDVIGGYGLTRKIK